MLLGNPVRKRWPDFFSSSSSHQFSQSKSSSPISILEAHSCAQFVFNHRRRQFNDKCEAFQPRRWKHSTELQEYAILLLLLLLDQKAASEMHVAPPDGAVIGTFEILLRMFWLNHSCVLRQFLGKINNFWRYPMFSKQSTTISQCPAEVFSECKIINASILNL